MSWVVFYPTSIESDIISHRYRDNDITKSGAIQYIFYLKIAKNGNFVTNAVNKTAFEIDNILNIKLAYNAYQNTPTQKSG